MKPPPKRARLTLATLALAARGPAPAGRAAASAPAATDTPADYLHSLPLALCRFQGDGMKDQIARPSKLAK